MPVRLRASQGAAVPRGAGGRPATAGAGTGRPGLVKEAGDQCLWCPVPQNWRIKSGTAFEPAAGG